MTKDFYDHMKEEQELLNLSYRESLRQKEERMAVWDPKDKPAVFSQIKKAINSPVSGFKKMTWVIVPGILIVFYFFIFFLLLSGCAYFQKEKEPEEKEFICKKIDCGNENIDEKVEEEKNVIACIKLLPECND